MVRALAQVGGLQVSPAVEALLVGVAGLFALWSIRPRGPAVKKGDELRRPKP